VKPKTIRCAIYTRKSTEHNLDLEFNSLHAQREACASHAQKTCCVPLRRDRLLKMPKSRQ